MHSPADTLRILGDSKYALSVHSQYTAASPTRPVSLGAMPHYLRHPALVVVPPSFSMHRQAPTSETVVSVDTQ